jgi:hypothetical protein
MSDQQQRTQWALDLFDGFVRGWTPPAAQEFAPTLAVDMVRVNDAIRAIAPKNDSKTVIGYAVFRREIDATYDIRDYPSGYRHSIVGAVFDRLMHAENVHRSQCKTHPENQYVICEIREIP